MHAWGQLCPGTLLSWRLTPAHRPAVHLKSVLPVSKPAWLGSPELWETPRCLPSRLFPWLGSNRVTPCRGEGNHRGASGAPAEQLHPTAKKGPGGRLPRGATRTAHLGKHSSLGQSASSSSSGPRAVTWLLPGPRVSHLYRVTQGRVSLPVRMVDSFHEFGGVGSSGGQRENWSHTGEEGFEHD